MKKLEENKVKSEREKEIEARIVRDNPNPISIGNGVHREESDLAKKEANDEAILRAKKEQ
ncbi:hypothetical protein DCS32_13290 [Dokdonia sp. Dokd-P16]|uniref:hypothetical protein n=1 Tax=Dokdonia sp. Dokd-P16 TaxID=2173169 RepID=UPI000D54708B|nr:hypothetical protein [Dokdonia sp. Dokd-P16]AWH75102.1 hypothetical protein DCS32_13290 [Dokdonia sp. Dokd-P16]